MRRSFPGKSFARQPAQRPGVPASQSVACTLYNASLECLGVGGFASDNARAFELNAQAAELGHRDAILAMGWFYLGGRGAPRNVALAQHWYRRSARDGEPRAMFSLGQMAYHARDYEEARRWFERAADRSHKRSLYWLGKLAWRGQCSGRDVRAAFAFFHRAAHAHDPEAIRALRFLSRRRRRD